MTLIARKKIKAFGLDISNSSIKVMELVREKGRLRPLAFSEVLISDKIINNHMIINEQKLADNINRAISLARRIDSNYVVCSIPETKSFVRSLLLPKMPESEIDGAIPFELEADIPIPIDQVYLDWQITKELSDKLQLLVTAAPKDYVDSLLESLRLAGLIPIVLELESQSLARALIGARDSSTNLLIVDISARQTNFVLVENGVVQYTSSIPVAGDNVTESIARSLNMSIQQADKLKRTIGLNSESSQGNARTAILPILDNIIAEIKSVIKFFEEHSSNRKQIDSIYLCGGSAQLLGLKDYVSARINLSSDSHAIAVNLGNPWINVAESFPKNAIPISPEIALGFTTVVGLALRANSYETD